MGPPDRAIAIVNPVAGRGKAGRRWPRLEAELRRHFPDLLVRYTTERGDAERWAREIASEPSAPRNDIAAAPRSSIVFAAGGDGTVHEVVNGLFHCGSSAHLGIIPLGTGNDFASTTGVPTPVWKCLSRLGMMPRRFDVGRVRFVDGSGTEQSRFFLNSASVGLVPHANRLAGRLKRLVAGRLPYMLGGIGALVRARAASYRTASVGRPLHTGPALSVTIANGARFGAGMRISPGSQADDGVLDQVVIGNLGKAHALMALSRLYAGTHVRMQGVTVTPLAGPLRIERDGGALLVEADGEEFTAGAELTIDVLPGAIHLVN